MDMYVEDLLSGCPTDICSNVEPFHCGIRQEDSAATFAQQRMNGFQLAGEQLQVVRGMPLGDDQRVQWLHRELVPDRYYELIFRNHLLWFKRAENAC